MKEIGFICPLGQENSETRKTADLLFHTILKPVAKEFGYEVKRPDLMFGSVIIEDVIQMIREVDIVVADLSNYNPNVFYELGIRQAVRGNCINIVSKSWVRQCEGKLPFDIRHYRAIQYELSLEEIEDLKEQLRQRIKRIQSAADKPIILPSESEVVRNYGITVVAAYEKGQKNQYDLAQTLFSEPVKKIFLMQRSSSLVLNAEQDCESEGTFITRLKNAIETCDEFYHVISLEGIEAHLDRKNSVFPHFKDFTENIERKGKRTIIKKKQDNAKDFYLRKMPKEEDDPLFKSDRQARVCITETRAGVVNAVIVQNLGDDQTTFQIMGPKAKAYLNACIDFYRNCQFVEWKEIKELYEKYDKRQKEKMES